MKATTAVKSLTLLLILLLSHGQAFAAQEEDRETIRIREKTRSLGMGNKVVLKLRSNNTEVKGIILHFDFDGLTIADKSSGQETVKKYSEVKTIRKDESRWKWVAVAGAVAGGIIVLVLVETRAAND
jgi:hypothetical protein